MFETNHFAGSPNAGQHCVVSLSRIPVISKLGNTVSQYLYNLLTPLFLVQVHTIQVFLARV